MIELGLNPKSGHPTTCSLFYWVINWEVNMKVVEIRKNLLVREDGLVKCISGSNRSRKYWNNGCKIGVKAESYRVVRVESKSFRIHRLIAEAFIPNPNKYLQVNHINHIQDDNRVDNLEWCTARYNSSHRKQHLKKLVGASFHKEGSLSNPWQSRICIKGTSKHLGMFATEQLAHERYLQELDIRNLSL